VKLPLARSQKLPLTQHLQAVVSCRPLAVLGRSARSDWMETIRLSPGCRLSDDGEEVSQQGSIEGSELIRSTAPRFSFSFEGEAKRLTSRLRCQEQADSSGKTGLTYYLSPVRREQLYAQSVFPLRIRIRIRRHSGCWLPSSLFLVG
jgi:hypothetical protein